jgi:hypothetical protein
MCAWVLPIPTNFGSFVKDHPHFVPAWIHQRNSGGRRLCLVDVLLSWIYQANDSGRPQGPRRLPGVPVLPVSVLVYLIMINHSTLVLSRLI